MATIRKRDGAKGTRYQALVRLDGVVRTSTFRTKSEAKVWAARAEAAITEGKHVPTVESKRRTVQDLLERYKNSVIPLKRDQRNPERYADFWIEKIGDRKLFKLSRATLVAVRDELAEERAPSTVNRYLALMSHACTMAEREWEWMTENPMRKVGRLKESTGRVRYLSDAERGKLLTAARDSEHPHLYAIVLLALTSGARKSEILELRWTDIDLVEGRAILQKTKNRDRRTLTLVAQVVEELRNIQKVRRIDDGRVFANPDTKRSIQNSFETNWRKARAEAGLKDFRFHDLRHSCASYLAMNGATLAEIAAVLGHKTLAMVKRYSHLSDEHVTDVVERTALKVLGDE